MVLERQVESIRNINWLFFKRKTADRTDNGMALSRAYIVSILPLGVHNSSQVRIGVRRECVCGGGGGGGGGGSDRTDHEEK